MKNSPLRVGVVGVGYLGAIHARIYKRLPNVVLVGVFDTDRTVADAVAKETKCRVFDTQEEMFDAIDAVSIVVPTSLHRVVAEPFLERGVPVLLEKPVAHTLEDSEAIVASAQKSSTLLQIGHLERFNAGIVRLAAELKNPRFLEVHRLGQFVARATDVDVVTDLMIHDIDIVLSLVPSELRYVSAVGTCVITDHVDIANARLEFSNGAIANVTASRISAKKFRRMRIFADSAYLALNFEDQQIDIARPGETAGPDGFAPIITDSIAVEHRPPLDAELADFVACVMEKREPVVSGEDGLKALRVAHEVRKRIDESLEIKS